MQTKKEIYCHFTSGWEGQICKCRVVWFSLGSFDILETHYHWLNYQNKIIKNCLRKKYTIGRQNIVPTIDKYRFQYTFFYIFSACFSKIIYTKHKKLYFCCLPVNIDVLYNIYFWEFSLLIQLEVDCGDSFTLDSFCNKEKNYST